MKTVQIDNRLVDVHFAYQPGRFPQRRYSVIGEVGGVHVSESGPTAKQAWRNFYVAAREQLKQGGCRHV
jgi:hypothetical protein